MENLAISRETTCSGIEDRMAGEQGGTLGLLGWEAAPCAPSQQQCCQLSFEHRDLHFFLSSGPSCFGGLPLTPLTAGLPLVCHQGSRIRLFCRATRDSRETLQTSCTSSII